MENTNDNQLKDTVDTLVGEASSLSVTEGADELSVSTDVQDILPVVEMAHEELLPQGDDAIA